jgi:hypothetical protein
VCICEWPLIAPSSMLEAEPHPFAVETLIAESQDRERGNKRDDGETLGYVH